MSDTSPHSAPSPAAGPAVLDGKYRLDQVLGRGGMGVVYRAVHLGTTRTVAVKVIAPRLGGDADFVTRFRREAEAAGRLRHPNVVDVTDFGFAQTAAGRVAYLVMEYLDGCSLEELMREETRLPVPFVSAVMEQVTSAVAEAHARGIVHRDLKPSNLWLEPDRRGGVNVKVLDFGLAKLADPSAGEPTPPDAAATSSPRPGGESATFEDQETLARPSAAPESDPPSTAPTLTRVGDTLGTPVYMSPEQCRGERVDARSDVYSLGVIAYRMLAGRPPFAGGETEVIRQHLHAAAPELRGVAKRVPKGLAALVMSALDKDPARRPLSAAALGAAFQARAESAALVLQQIFALYAGHFGPLVRLMGLALAPVAALALLVAALIQGGVAEGTLRTVLLLMVMFELVGVLLLCAPLYAPIVAQLLLSPLRPVRLRPLLNVARAHLATYLRLFRPLLLFVGYFLVLGPALYVMRPATRALTPDQRAWLAAAAIGGPLLLYLGWFARNGLALRFAGVAMLMEGLDAQSALARSKRLVEAGRGALSGFDAAFGAMTLPMLVFGGLTGVIVTRVAKSGAAAVALLLAAPVWAAALAVLLPLPLVGSALLYFKLRQSQGEPLAEALADFERRSLPAEARPLRFGERLRRDVSARGLRAAGSTDGAGSGLDVAPGRD